MSSLTTNKLFILTIPFSYESLCNYMYISKYQINDIYTKNNSFTRQQEIVRVNDTISEKKIIIKKYTERKSNLNIANITVYEGNPLNTIDYTIKPLTKSTSDLLRLKIERTDILCWWCCHSFDTFPIPAPIKYSDKKEDFDVEGCFCSFNCISSYLSKKKGIKDTSLVKLLYNKLCLPSNKEIKKKKLSVNGYLHYNNISSIKKAPPKEILESFGGPISIEKYRESFNTLTTFTLNKSPMIYRHPENLEECNIEDEINESILTIKTNKESNIILTNSSIDSSNKRTTILKKEKKKETKDNLSKKGRLGLRQIMGLK